MLCFRVSLSAILLGCLPSTNQAFSLQESSQSIRRSQSPSRRAFLANTVLVTGAVSSLLPSPARAAPEIFTTANGIKYATTKNPREKTSPRDRDIVAIEYTGYLTSGQIFDATHSEGKKNALMFAVGGGGVIDGLSEMVKEMSVGQKVQAIIPPDKGICLENGECLVKPKSPLVYDIYLKQSAIPPP